MKTTFARSLGKRGPGIYYDVGREEYDAIPAFNSSLLKPACKTLKHYLRQLNRTQEYSYALEFGRAFALLKDGRRDLISVGPTATAGTKAWLAEMATLPREAAMVLEKDMGLLDAMAEAVKAHPVASDIEAQIEHREACLLWTDAETGEPMKALLDGFGGSVLADYKTTRDCEPRKIEWQIRDFGYQVQVAVYHAGLCALGMSQVQHVYCVFVEKTAPLCDVVVRKFPHWELLEGQQAYRDAIRRIQAAEKDGKWSGWANRAIEPEKSEFASFEAGEENETE